MNKNVPIPFKWTGILLARAGAAERRLKYAVNK